MGARRKHSVVTQRFSRAIEARQHRADRNTQLLGGFSAGHLLFKHHQECLSKIIGQVAQCGLHGISIFELSGEIGGIGLHVNGLLDRQRFPLSLALLLKMRKSKSHDLKQPGTSVIGLALRFHATPGFGEGFLNEVFCLRVIARELDGKAEEWARKIAHPPLVPRSMSLPLIHRPQPDQLHTLSASPANWSNAVVKCACDRPELPRILLPFDSSARRYSDQCQKRGNHPQGHSHNPPERLLPEISDQIPT